MENMTFLSSLIEVYFEGANIGKNEGFKVDLGALCFSRKDARAQRGSNYSSMRKSK